MGGVNPSLIALELEISPFCSCCLLMGLCYAGPTELLKS